MAFYLVVMTVQIILYRSILAVTNRNNDIRLDGILMLLNHLSKHLPIIHRSGGNLCGSNHLALLVYTAMGFVSQLGFAARIPAYRGIRISRRDMLAIYWRFFLRLYHPMILQDEDSSC